MRIFGGLSLVLLLAGGLLAQHGNYNNIQPFLTGGFGNVVYPGGTSATVPGLQRFTPNVVYPGGGGPHLVVPNPNRRGFGEHRGFGDRGYLGSSLGYYPLYVGGFGYGYGVDPSLGGDPPAPPPAPQAQPSQQPPVTVVYPPQPAPVIINQFGSGGDTSVQSQAPVRPRMYDMPPADAQAETQTDTSEPSHYLIAFKDHTIYAAVAYWVEGDTLHYFTAGNTHNQASLSLVDRDLTLRLNKESGVDIKLPPPQQ